MGQDTLHMRISASAQDFAHCTAKVEDFCAHHNLPHKFIFQITLVLDELITNIISYGYDAPGTHSIEISLSLDNELLRIRILDDGRPFNPLQDAEEPELEVPLELRKRPIGGMGIHLVKSIMDTIEYERRENTNVLTLTKDLATCLLGKAKNT